MKKILLIVLLFILTIALSVVATIYVIDTSETPSTYEIHQIQSKVLSENREIIVKLPQGYEHSSTQTYPVIYVFGGNSLTYSIAYDTDLLTRTGHLQKLIVVGISNISQDTRQRDLTPPFMKQDLDEADSPMGKADEYLNFISKEVIFLIEEKYHTSETKIAVGHSREGLMVMYSLIARPNLFTARLALSPALWRENNLFVEHLSMYLEDTDTLLSYLFLSMGDQEVEKMKRAFDLTVDLLKTDSIHKKINWESLYTQDATHANNGQLSAPIGIERALKRQF